VLFAMPSKKTKARRARIQSAATPGASISLAPDRVLALFCWILGVSASPFPVDIEDNQTVGHLKEAIVNKKPRSLSNVEPDELKLWKVSGCFRFVLATQRLQFHPKALY